MPFLSKQASSNLFASSSTGGYLNLTKLADKASVRVTILQPEPKEYFELWGQCDGQSKPFRWEHDPTAEDISTDLGDFEPREGRGGPGTYDIKFCVACPVFNYDTGSVQIWAISQKTILKELDDIAQMEDYDKDVTSIDLVIGKEIQSNGIPKYTIRPVPKKKGSQEHVAAAWIETQEAGFDIDRLITGQNPFKAN